MSEFAHDNPEAERESAIKKLETAQTELGKAWASLQKQRNPEIIVAYSSFYERLLDKVGRAQKKIKGPQASLPGQQAVNTIVLELHTFISIIENILHKQSDESKAKDIN